MSDFLRVYGPILVTGLQLLLAWFLWSMRREFTTTTKCEQHRQKIASDCSLSREKISSELKIPADKVTGDIEALKLKTIADIEALKVEVAKLPDRKEIREFTKMVVDLNTALGELKGRLSGMGRAVDLMNEHHLRESEKKG